MMFKHASVLVALSLLGQLVQAEGVSVKLQRRQDLPSNTTVFQPKELDVSSTPVSASLSVSVP
jgi:hypothetical protein